MHKASFPQVAWFITRTRVRSIFMEGRNVFFWNVLRFAILVFIVGSGYVYGILYDAVLASENLDIPRYRMDTVIHGLAIMVVFMVNYVPSFRPRSQYIGPLFPVSAHFHTAINLYGDLLNIIYLYALAFIAAMVASGEAFGFHSGLNAALFLLMVILVERNVKVLIEQKLKRFAIYLVLVGLHALPVGLYQVFGIPMDDNLLSAQTLAFAGLSVIALVLQFLLSSAPGEKRDQVVAVRRTNGRYMSLAAFSMRFYFRRKATLFAVVMVTVSKAFALGFWAFLFNSDSITPQEEALQGYYILMLLLPVVPFSYVHNNWSGFFRETWYSWTLQSGKCPDLLKAWFQSLMPVLALDILLAVIVTFVIGMASLEILVLWVLILALFTPLGILASMQYPIYIERLFSMQSITRFRNNSSPLYLLYFLIVMLVLFTALAFDIIMWLVVPVAILSYVLFLTAKSMFPAKKYRIYQKLFHED